MRIYSNSNNIICSILSSNQWNDSKPRICKFAKMVKKLVLLIKLGENDEKISKEEYIHYSN